MTADDIRKQAVRESKRTGMSEVEILVRWLSNEMNRVTIVESSAVYDRRGHLVRFKYPDESDLTRRWATQ
jgi:hypothetical protein